MSTSADPAEPRRRVAILGAGMIGEVHRRAALLAGADIVGVGIGPCLTAVQR